jgi:copper(I)-binding protein
MRHDLRLAAIGGALCLLSVTVTVGAPALAQAQMVQASDAWARRAPAMGHADGHKMEKMDKMGGTSRMAEDSTGAVYVTLTNPSSQSDSLVSAASDAAQTVELHEVKNEAGVMKMRPVPRIVIPAGGKVVLKPGGYHVMLLGLKHDLKVGEKVPVTLKFERGGELHIEAVVR